MNTKIDKYVAKLTVRLRDVQSKNTMGTGVLYYSHDLKNRVYILSAAHVVYEDADGFTVPLSEIYVDLYNPLNNDYEPILCTVNHSLVSPDINNDIVVLILDKERVERITGPLQSVECLQERHSITNYIVKGFPEATRGQELVTIHPTWKQSMTGVDKFQMEMREDYQGWSMNGFSGSGTFLQVKEKAYLFGIFTRYREEGRGKIIYCQYLQSYNELLYRNFSPEISFAYLGEHGLIQSFFENQVTFAVKNLGPRFNEKLNFRLPIAQLFNDLAKDGVFKRGVLNILDRWLVAKNFSYHKNDTKILIDVETAYSNARTELIEYISHIGWQANQPIKLEGFIEQIHSINIGLRGKLSDLFDLQRKERDQQSPEIRETPSYRPPYAEEINRVREIERNNHALLEELEARNINLCNHPCLLIQGEAGCGKSHLLGDIATERIKDGRPTLLLLGQLFKSSENCWKQLLEQLGLSCSKVEFLTSLNSIGEQTGSRVLILIDALNEGAGKDLWPDILAGFIDEISRYQFIGLALTIRSSYYKAVIPDAVTNNRAVVSITHKGFKGNEYEALRLFCNHYDLQQPNFPILAPEFTNPLFLQLICDGLKTSNQKVFPQGFQGASAIFNFYLKAVTAKLSVKREEYQLKPKIVRQAIEEMARAMHAKKEVKLIVLEDAVKLFEDKFNSHRFLLGDLIHENVFIQSTYENYQTTEEEVIYFAYERLGDFFIAEELLKPFSTAQEVKDAFKEGLPLGDLLQTAIWRHNGLFEALAVLLPEKFDLEIVEVYAWAFVGKHKGVISNIGEWLGNYLLDSLKWRKTISINDEKITKWINSKRCRVDHHTFYNRILELTTIKDHPFNSDRFTHSLLHDPLPLRDSKWQEFFWYYSGHNNNDIGYPLRRLIDWAWQPHVSSKIDIETARLTGQTLCWVLSSTFRKLRDETTKALVNLLEEQPEALLMLLKKFETIDDPYIAERLYAVAYGCALRTTNIDSLALIAQYVYEHIFSKGNPPLHVLLRDYARNIIEYAIHKKAITNVNIKLVRPPYNSKMPENYPTEEDIKAFELDRESDYYKQNNGRLFNYIKFSILNWDFGDKTINSALRDFSPVSFTMERDYKAFLKGLKREQRVQVQIMEGLLRLKSGMENPKKYRYSDINHELIDSIRGDTEKRLEVMPALLEKILSPKEYTYFVKQVLPHFSNMVRIKKGYLNTIDAIPLKRWIVQRAHGLGYRAELHTRFDDSVQRYNYRGEHKIERIGKKYQWIALHEMVAMLADNYKHSVEEYYEKKYKYFQGPWQRYLRDINPSFIRRDKIKDADEPVHELNDKWWWDNSYQYWDGVDTVWVSNLNDLPAASFILQRTDPNGTDWLYLRTNMSWHEAKSIGEERYETRRKEIWYLLQGYLVRKKDRKRILEWTKKQNFKGRNLLETHKANLSLFNRENYWSPVSQTNEAEKWINFGESKNKVMVTTSEATGELSEDKSGAHSRYDMPCKLIFEGMDLSYAAKDGDFINYTGKLIATTTDRNGVLIHKGEFLKYLEENELDILWVLFGEKRVVGGDHNANLFTSISGVYAIEGNNIVGDFPKETKDAY